MPEQHLKVGMEREVMAGDLEVWPRVALERVTLSDNFCARLTVAAELHSTTALKACLPELRALGPSASRLAEEIRLLMRSYDMDGIQRLLAAYVSRPPETTSHPHAD